MPEEEKSIFPGMGIKASDVRSWAKLLPYLLVLLGGGGATGIMQGFDIGHGRENKAHLNHVIELLVEAKEENQACQVRLLRVLGVDQ